MKIVVLAKHVPDATGERTFAPDGTVDRTAGDGLLSELDEYAVEQALQIAEDGEDVEVVVMTLGPDDAADAIKRALQMGASAGIHIVDDAVHGSDALATSALLAEAIKRATPDLVICGMASTDGTMGVIPAMVAERLGWPAVTLGATLSAKPGIARCVASSRPRRSLSRRGRLLILASIPVQSAWMRHGAKSCRRAHVRPRRRGASSRRKTVHRHSSIS
jgi:electron transfer flavoprotein beta subunit